MEKGAVFKEAKKELTCCFSGHRHIPADKRDALARALETTIREYIEAGYRYFFTGGALGFDTLAAQVILALREQYPQIRLALILPCMDQAAKWRQEDRELYNRILEAADDDFYVELSYTPQCMLKRNRQLVNDSNVCICYCTHGRSGTMYTMNYARQTGVFVINLADRI